MAQDLTVVKSEPLPMLTVTASEPLPGDTPAKPPTWMQQHPKTRQAVKGVLDTLPVAGGIAGAAIAGPETLGLGSIPAGAVGVGVGRGARDLLAEYLGVDDPTSPLSKAARISLDTVVAAATPVIAGTVKRLLSNPKATLADFLETTVHPKDTAGKIIDYLRTSGPKVTPRAQFTGDISGQVDRYMPNVSAASEAATHAAQDSALSVAARETNASPAEMAALQERLFPGRANPATDIAAVKALVASGVPPSAAIRQLVGDNPTRFGSLMTLYMRSRQVK